MFCVLKKYEQTEKMNKDVLKKDQKGAEMITINAIFCFQNCMSSAVFVNLNNKDSLSGEFPTKNDGPQHFFELRDLAYDKLKDTVAKNLKLIKYASFSLDKE